MKKLIMFLLALVVLVVIPSIAFCANVESESGGMSSGIIIAAVSVILWIGNFIVKRTPTEKDDNIFKVIEKILMLFMKSKKKGGGYH